MPQLQWCDKKDAVSAAKRGGYRLIEEDTGHSYGDTASENLLIQGDNLEVLKALTPHYSGRVKCVYIDPPYNTGSTFEHYADRQQHSRWLSSLWPRLELMWSLLAPEGSIWISIDDRQSHYLKVMLDELFGRACFVANIVWQKRTSRENRKAIGSSHDHILVYAPMGAQQWKRHRNALPGTGEGYSNPDNDPKGPWRSTPFSAQGYRKNQMYPIMTPTGELLEPPKGRCWGATEPVYRRLQMEGRVYFPKGGRGRPRIKKYQFEDSGLAPMTWWSAADFGDNQQAKKETLALFPEQTPFDTPKPERLIERILHIATHPGDLVLDAYLGSGSTMAVAMKSGRRTIGIEQGAHALTYCVPRLQQVVDGEQGGVSAELGWTGGSGFRFCRLGATVADDTGALMAGVGQTELAAHHKFRETGRPHAIDPLNRSHNETALCLQGRSQYGRTGTRPYETPQPATPTESTQT